MSVGTPVASCNASPPMIIPPKRKAETIDHNGFSAPKRATTIPLNPSEFVNPVRLPSVTIRCATLPKTSSAPPRPHMAPLMVIASVIVRFTGIPEYLAASRDRPTAWTRKPKPVR